MLVMQVFSEFLSSSHSILVLLHVCNLNNAYQTFAFTCVHSCVVFFWDLFSELCYAMNRSQLCSSLHDIIFLSLFV